MILIVDCGSTKVDWCVLDAGKEALRFVSPGMNAVLLSAQEIADRMQEEVSPQLAPVATDITEIYFYGAGCISPAVCQNVADALKAMAPNAKVVEVASDLLAAARALCGKEPGVACILGTGSNSCFYDGKEIVKGVSPLGYILGDEGSGAVLGKLLVGNVLKGQLPKDLCEKFLKQYDLDLLGIIDRVYRKPAANKFLASLSPFLLENIERPEVESMVFEAFRQFFVRNVSHYNDCFEPGSLIAVNFVGSIAHYYTQPLRDAALMSGYVLGKVLQGPMDGLIEYHNK